MMHSGKNHAFINMISFCVTVTALRGYIESGLYKEMVEMYAPQRVCVHVYQPRQGGGVCLSLNVTVIDFT